jgi:4-amino-4-deoxy-L-arabinose transferase-like glycosyltransferase
VGQGGAAERGATAAGQPAGRAPRWASRGLAAIILSYLVLATVQSYATRLQWGPDEPAHIIYVRSLAEDGRLPDLVSDERRDAYAPGAARSHQAHHPPVYYALAAAVWRVFSRLPDVEVSYRAEPDGAPSSYLVPGPVRACRLLSCALGMLTLLLVYGAARTAFPEIPAVWLAAPALIAFTPMFTYLSGVVNNDVLLTVFFAAAAWSWAHLLRAGGSLRSAAALGVICGLGVEVKETALALVPVSAIVLALAPGADSWGKRLGWLAAFAGGAAALGIWWYLHKWLVYGRPFVYAYHDPLVDLPTQRMVGVATALPGLIFAFFFTPLDVIASHVDVRLLYGVLGILTLASLAGVARAVIAGRGGRRPRAEALYLGLCLLTALIVLTGIVRLVFLTDWRMGPAGGRYLSAAMPMIALASARGIAALFGNGRGTKIALGVAGALLLALNVTVIRATAIEYGTLIS